MLRMEHATKKGSRRSLVLEDGKVEMVFPVIEPQVNPIAFIRFALILNIDYAVYMSHPFDYDSRIVGEFASLGASTSAPEDRRRYGQDARGRLCICSAEPVQSGLQVKFDCLLFHPFLATIGSQTRHKRSEDQWITIETKVAAMMLDAAKVFFITLWSSMFKYMERCCCCAVICRFLGRAPCCKRKLSTCPAEDCCVLAFVKKCGGMKDITLRSGVVGG